MYVWEKTNYVHTQGRGIQGVGPLLELEVYVVKISKIRKFNYFFSIGPPLGKNCSLAPVHTIWNSFPFNLV